MTERQRILDIATRCIDRDAPPIAVAQGAGEALFVRSHSAEIWDCIAAGQTQGQQATPIAADPAARMFPSLATLLSQSTGDADDAEEVDDGDGDGDDPPCRDCGGSGESEDGDICPRCNGSGREPSEDDEDDELDDDDNDQRRSHEDEDDE